jgi:anti-anti-sigma factor
MVRFGLAVDRDLTGPAIYVSGDLDIAAAPLLKTAAELALTGPGADAESLVLDLADLTFIDAAGIAALIWIHDLAKEKEFRFALRSVRPWIAHVLRHADIEIVPGHESPSAQESVPPQAQRKGGLRQV